MKPKKFEKVVEWERKPDFELLATGSFMALIGLFGCGLAVSGCFHYPLVVGLIFFSNSVCTMVVGALMFFYSLGKGRKVYYVEVKDE